ncbi:MAG: YjbF family lipoprotein [Burkholderiales bacterium]
MFQVLSRLPILCLALTLLILGGCGHTPVTRTLFEAIPGLGRSVDNLNLNPNLRYLRVSVRGRVVLMVLGYVDAHPDGPIDVWYSAEGEVIRLQNGRIVGTAGLETDWRAVRNVSPPVWKDVVGRSTTVYRRERDEMPGYRFSIKERVSVYPVRVPTNARVVGIPVQNLRWYEEAILDQKDGLPSARFALQVKDSDVRVIYGEQCLSQILCIAWQTWPATP